MDGLDDAAKKNLFVGHLSYNIDEEWLTREFEGFGAITRCVHMVDRETQRPRGYVNQICIDIWQQINDHP